MKEKILMLTDSTNPRTTKHTLTAKLYMQPFFDNTDIVTIVDIRNMKQHSNLHIYDIHVGRYTYMKITTSVFGKHIGKNVMLIPLKESIRHKLTRISQLGFDAFYVESQTNKDKQPLLILVMNEAFYGNLLGNILS